jgi:hypothetical protein
MKSLIDLDEGMIPRQVKVLWYLYIEMLLAGPYFLNTLIPLNTLISGQDFHQLKAISDTQGANSRLLKGRR